jgi:lysine biosynthesis protein LysW
MARRIPRAAKADCPECDSIIYFDRRPRLGQIVFCSDCQSRLEVISKHPLLLSWNFDDEFVDLNDGFDDAPYLLDDYNWMT